MAGNLDSSQRSSIFGTESESSLGSSDHSLKNSFNERNNSIYYSQNDMNQMLADPMIQEREQKFQEKKEMAEWKAMNLNKHQTNGFVPDNESFHAPPEPVVKPMGK